MAIKIKALKNLYNKGECFTKGKVYELVLDEPLHNEASLIDRRAINNLGEEHIIGGWWRDFKIVKNG